MSNCIIGRISLVSLTAKWAEFDEFKSGGQREKHAVASWNLGTISAFAGRQKKTKEPCYELAGRVNKRISEIN
jgi:hypothetical protein